MHGISIVSGVIFLAIIIAATAIVYQAGVPVIQELQSTAAVNKMKTTMAELDKVIRNVARQGQGGKQVVFISSDPGKLTIDGDTDTIIWELDTNAPIISPRTSQQFGNLIIGSNLETSVTEGTFDRVSPAVPAFIMENSRLIVYLNRSGAPDNHLPIATSAIFLGVYNKDLDSWMDNPGFMDFALDDNPASQRGIGYTAAEKLGSNLPFGRVQAYFDTSYADYRIYIELSSGADFLILEGEQA